jgi:hypothetical protein
MDNRLLASLVTHTEKGGAADPPAQKPAGSSGQGGGGLGPELAIVAATALLGSLLWGIISRSGSVRRRGTRGVHDADYFEKMVDSEPTDQP